MTCFIVSLNAQCGYHVHKIKNYKNKDHCAGPHGEIPLSCRSIPSKSCSTVNEEVGTNCQYRLVSCNRKMM